MILLLLCILGVIFGSFINALVWRLHEQLDEDGNPKSLSRKRQAEVSVSKGRSMCPYCKHTLAAKDLIPVLSWLLLKGKCRYCSYPISKQYPIVELLTGGIFVLSYIAWPNGLTESWQVLCFATWLASAVGLIALAVYDLRWMLLPDRILTKLYLLVFLSYIFQFALGRPISDAVQILFGIIVAGGVFFLLNIFSDGKWIGGGDVKLGFLLGAILGSGSLAFLCLFIASLLGISWVIPGFITKRITKESKIPFGPFLIVASAISILWGPQLISWYVGTLLGY